MAAKKKHRSVKEIESQTFLHSAHVGGLGSDGILITTKDSKFLCFRSDLKHEVIQNIQSEAYEIAKEEAARPQTCDKVWVRRHGEWLPPIIFTDIGYGGMISPPMAPKEVDLGDHLTNHISELQSQAKLSPETKQRPSHYPHENVVFHVTQLQAEAQSQQVPPAGSGVIYDRGRLMTVAQASRVSGVKVGTIHNLISDGILTERGRIIAPGGGKVLINLDELDSVPKRPVGRPKKSPERLSRKRPRGRPRKNP